MPRFRTRGSEEFREWAAKSETVRKCLSEFPLFTFKRDSNGWSSSYVTYEVASEPAGILKLLHNGGKRNLFHAETRWKPCFSVEFVSVRPKFQGRGIGAKLFERAFSMSAGNGFAHLASTEFTQDGARSLQPHVGKLSKKYGVAFVQKDHGPKKKVPA